jgi:hypothetical protein
LLIVKSNLIDYQSINIFHISEVIINHAFSDNFNHDLTDNKQR